VTVATVVVVLVAMVVVVNLRLLLTGTHTLHNEPTIKTTSPLHVAVWSTCLSAS